MGGDSKPALQSFAFPPRGAVFSHPKMPAEHPDIVLPSSWCLEEGLPQSLREERASRPMPTEEAPIQLRENSLVSCTGNMSKTPNPTKAGSKKELPSEASPDAASKPESSKLSGSLLTVENVKKHQEENPVAKPNLAQWSIETYIEESNRLLSESGSRTEGSKEQRGSSEEKSGALHEGYPENADQTLGKDFQTRPLSTPVPESQLPKKREVADLETQTEWSYSVSSEDSSEPKIEKKEPRSTDRKEKSETTESTEILYHTEEGVCETELETQESTSEEEKIKSSVLDEEHSVTDLCLIGRCEFCTSLLKPLPSPEELEEKPERMDHFLCCRTYKEVFQCVVQELMERRGSEIDIRPHHRGSLESKTRRMLMEDLQERGFERYREIFMQYIKYGPCIKIHFKFSDHPPQPETESLEKRYPEPKQLLEMDLGFKAEQLKLLLNYPSGRLAILITYERETQFTYSVLRDTKGGEILAFFTNQGYAAHDQPKGRLRLNLDLCRGSVFDEKGQRQKFWSWWDLGTHVHAPPFQPVCLQLNVYIRVKLKAQDQVFLTFTKAHDGLCLNVGARLRLKDSKMLWVLQRYGTTRHLVSPSLLEKIGNILTHVKKLLKKLDSDPSKEAADLRLISKVYERMHRRQRQPKERN